MSFEVYFGDFDDVAEEIIIGKKPQDRDRRHSEPKLYEDGKLRDQAHREPSRGRGQRRRPCGHNNHRGGHSHHGNKNVEVVKEISADEGDGRDSDDSTNDGSDGASSVSNDNRTRGRRQRGPRRGRGRGKGGKEQDNKDDRKDATQDRKDASQRGHPQEPKQSSNLQFVNPYPVQQPNLNQPRKPLPLLPQPPSSFGLPLVRPPNAMPFCPAQPIFPHFSQTSHPSFMLLFPPPAVTQPFPSPCQQPNAKDSSVFHSRSLTNLSTKNSTQDLSNFSQKTSSWGIQQSLNQDKIASKQKTGRYTKLPAEKTENRTRKTSPDSNRGQQDSRQPNNDQTQTILDGEEILKKLQIVDEDEWIKVFKLLLEKFEGRAKFGTFLSNKKDLLEGLNHQEIGKWIKFNSSKFITFEKDDTLKHVSVFFHDARICFNYKDYRFQRCKNDKCAFFHICKSFVNGSCQFGNSCRFSHSFHSKGNKKVCSDLGLQIFTNEEIRIIVFRSTPAVCKKYSKSGCENETCPDVHVCSQYILQKCTTENCKLSHAIKESEHNMWVLKSFRLNLLPEHVLIKMISVQQPPVAGQSSDASKPVTETFLPNHPKTDVTSPNKAKDSSTSNLTDIPADKPKKARPRRKRDVVKLVPLVDHASSCQSEPESAGDSFVSDLIDLTDMEVPAAQPKETRSRWKKDAAKTRSLIDDHLSFSPLVEPLVPTSEEPLVSKYLSGADDDDAVLVDPNPEPLKMPENHPAPSDQAFLVDHNPEPLKMPEACLVGFNPEPEGLSVPSAHYSHLCEDYSWTGTCPRGHMCSRCHHKDHPHYLWQILISGSWQEFSSTDNLDIEKQFCALSECQEFEVVMNGYGLKMTVDFVAMKASVQNEISTLEHKIRRWSTLSYVEAETNSPLHHYTQWCWYWMDHSSSTWQPYSPGSLQFTLEEKFVSGQMRYFYEVGDFRYMIDMKGCFQVDLDNHQTNMILRRPVFVPTVADNAEQVMSPLLLPELPPPLEHSIPANWSKVDYFQEFELVELDLTGSEYLSVARNFHGSLDSSTVKILSIFRIQNPKLWDKYCSTKRSMTPRDAREVDERNLFHGTPTLQSVRGICANNIDFRKAGENVGAIYGKGSYFSKDALYSNAYTEGLVRYMFQAKVLVGKYTLGKEEYKFPPYREGLKRYDSCVNDEANPRIFVIFDLAQSYPEYLIQYEDVTTMQSRQQQPRISIHGSLQSSVPISSSTSVYGKNEIPLLSDNESLQKTIPDPQPASPMQRPVPAPRKLRESTSSSMPESQNQGQSSAAASLIEESAAPQVSLSMPSPYMMQASFGASSVPSQAQNLPSYYGHPQGSSGSSQARLVYPKSKENSSNDKCIIA